MNLKSLIKRAEDVDKVFQELQTDLAEAINESLESLENDPDEDLQAKGDSLQIEGAKDEVTKDEVTKGEVAEAEPPLEDSTGQPVQRLTSHTQTRLAALGAVDGLFHEAQDYLEEITAKLSEIGTSHHLTREFLTILHGDILRANELELANTGLAAEQRALSQQLHDAVKKQRERESAVEVLQQRETSLVQERESLRTALAAARLELVEAANASARREAEFGDAVKSLSDRTVEANRRSREIKTLREKQVNLSIDLDRAQKREAEARHRLDELLTTHRSEAARIADLVAAFVKSEKEEMRLQTGLEMAQAKLSEMTEAARLVEADRQAEQERAQAEMSGLRAEIQGLQSRLELAANENGEAAGEVARLKTELSDAMAEKQVADERLTALMNESENDKINLSTVSADLSQLTLQQASEQIQLDIQKQECEDLRAEIASLNARIQELLPYERLHRVTEARARDDAASARPRDDAVVVEIKGVVAEKARATHRRRAHRNLRATS